ncbi:aspartate/glutamate racemase family protein [bacterium]|nr:aspartate/glutamate racemase family protein [bacterium]
MMNRYKIIGIIGGQGPTSTADFYLRIIKYYQDNFRTRHVGDFPPMIIFSVPTPDLVEAIEDEEKTFMLIAEAIKKLEKDGSDFIVITCNALQYLLKRFQALVKIPIIGIASTVAEHIKDKGYKAVGILAVDTTIRKKVYDPFLEEKGIKLIRPDQTDQDIIEEVILDEYSGKTNAENTEKIKKVAKKLYKNGAEAVMLACTELPLILKQKDIDIPLIDCNEIYAQKAAQLSSEQ